ncbi:alpha/beta hydrolase [Desulfospira joergensenii]|uniref:alpha/beta hydrolase n=1 Tax=Desulfospira joergensenii TaxID=53329 RepID=UPI0003B5AA75|nr:alpha/beta fold hydrolase [Desulfospira joergensenii]
MNIEFKVRDFCLRGKLHLPKNKRPALVIGSHGLEGSMNSAKQMVLSRLLPENGIAFFRFDHRGCGSSDGDFIKETSLEKRTEDYLAAVQHLIDLDLFSGDIGLFGSSMGGATCINAWNLLEQMEVNLRGGVLCSAPVRSRTIENIPVQANDSRPALPLTFFAENLLFDILDKAQDLHHVLVFHGDRDEVVPVSNALELHDRMRSPKKLIIHKNGDHQMTDKGDQDEFERETLSWFLSICKA